PEGSEVFSWRLLFGDQGQAPHGLRSEHSVAMKTLRKKAFLFVMPRGLKTHRIERDVRQSRRLQVHPEKLKGSCLMSNAIFWIGLFIFLKCA
ncbi:hypothetical protein ACQP3J_30620, partial [Escherichia coli]